MFKKGNIGGSPRFLKGTQTTDVKRFGNLHARHLFSPAHQEEMKEKAKNPHLEKK